MLKIKKIRKSCLDKSTGWIIHRNKETGLVIIEDSNWLKLMTHQETRELIEGLEKYMNLLTDKEIKSYNSLRRREIISEYEEQTGKKYN